MNLISIIIPCYNQAQYLPDALQSVMEQTYENWECIIINDGSSDNTHEVAEKWIALDNRFKYTNIKNGGVSTARNLGLSLSNGSFVQFLDADDVLEKDKLLLQVKFLEVEESVDIVYSSSRYFYSNNKIDLFALHSSGVVPTIDISKEDLNQKEILFLRNVCTICGSLYRKKIFEVLKFKDVAYEDWLFHIECSLNNYKFHFEKLKGATSLIRMTNQSQMLNHGQNRESQINFENELVILKKDFNFKSKLTTESTTLQSNDCTYKSNLFKVVLINLMPPILLTTYKKITSK